MNDQEKHIQGEANGHNGLIQYEVDVNDDKIKDLKILKHSETSGIFNQVIGQLKDNIVSQQSFDVDAVSGATVMTQAILDSAKEAVSKEDVKLTPVPKKETTHQTTRLKTDVAIIGGGEAGLVAVVARSYGSKVVLVERTATWVATILNGSNVVGTGSRTSEAVFGQSSDSQGISSGCCP